MNLLFLANFCQVRRTISDLDPLTSSLFESLFENAAFATTASYFNFHPTGYPYSIRLLHINRNHVMATLLEGNYYLDKCMHHQLKKRRDVCLCQIALDIQTNFFF